MALALDCHSATRSHSIVSFPGYNGVFNLACTNHVPDLLLHTLTLGFIIDLDEYLYETLVPTRLQRILG